MGLPLTAKSRPEGHNFRHRMEKRGEFLSLAACTDSTCGVPLLTVEKGLPSWLSPKMHLAERLPSLARA